MSLFKRLWNLFVKSEEEKAVEPETASRPIGGFLGHPLMSLPKAGYTKRMTPHRVKLAKYLLSKGHSQADIAAFLGTTQPRISDIATGKRWSSVHIDSENDREELNEGHQFFKCVVQYQRRQ